MNGVHNLCATSFLEGGKTLDSGNEALTFQPFVCAIHEGQTLKTSALQWLFDLMNSVIPNFGVSISFPSFSTGVALSESCRLRDNS